MSKVIAHKNIEIARGKLTLQDDFLESRINQLLLYAKQLRSLSRTLVFLLFINFVVAVILGLNKEYELFNRVTAPSWDTGLIYLAIIFIVFGVGFYILYRFNNTRKKGMSLYAEITDDIAWGKKRKEYIYHPPIKARNSIKDFLHATDLPFTSGINGQAIYVLGFVLISLAALILQVKL